MKLEPVDLLVLSKLFIQGGAPWTIRSVAIDICLSDSEIHRSLRRCEAARLLNREERSVLKRNFEEFILHGAKYAFPADLGGPTIGLPTSYGAPPLNKHIVSDQAVPVWPDSEGPVAGYALAPLHKAVVCAARKDSALYEILALIDVMRSGRAREVSLATEEIVRRLREDV